MKIGYTALKDCDNEKELIFLKQHCDKVYCLDGSDSSQTYLIKILHKYKDEEIVISNFESLGIQFSQFGTILNIIKKNNIKVTFLDTYGIPRDKFIFVLNSLQNADQKNRKKQTKNGITLAQKNGKVVGRPRISEKKILEIEALKRNKKTIREIASLTGASVGTVYKYSKLGYVAKL